MALNPNYETIGKAFTQQYYAMFDDPTQRANLVNMYNVRDLRFSWFFLGAAFIFGLLFKKTVKTADCSMEAQYN